MPLFLGDGAHNGLSAESLAGVINSSLSGERHAGKGVSLLLAGTRGHCVPEIAQQLIPHLVPLTIHGHVSSLSIILTQTKHPNRMPLHELSVAFEASSIEVSSSHEDSAVALDLALDAAGPAGVVIATGSMFLAAEAIQAYLRRGGSPV